MNISIILAHPNPGSFNHAIAQAAAEALRQNRHQVALHDLYQEQFPPLFSAAELQTNANLDPVIARHCKEIAGANGIIIVHPNWWGMPPAILKGWIDRVLRMEIAYRFVANDKGEGVPVGLLKAKAAIVFNTANTPEDREREIFGDPLENLWKKCVFDLCGVRNVHRRTFSVVITSTPRQRAEWLQEAAKTAARYFPPPPARVPVELRVVHAGKSATPARPLPRRHGRIALRGELTPFRDRSGPAPSAFSISST